MIRAAWICFSIALGSALALLLLGAPNSLVDVALALTFLCAAPICFNALREVGGLFRR